MGIARNATLRTKKQKVSKKEKETDKCKGWMTMFPAEMNNPEKSTNFLKRLLAVATSTIVYFRHVFDKDSFNERDIEGITVMVVNSKCKKTSTFLSWMAGAYDGMEHKYLESFSLGLFTDKQNPNKMQEIYKFEFTYTEGVPRMEILGYKSSGDISTETIQAETMKLFKTLLDCIHSINNKRHQKDSIFVTVKLAFNENTPADYQPPGFRDSRYGRFAHAGLMQRMHAGRVSTSFHLCSVDVEIDKTLLLETEREQTRVSVGPRSTEACPDITSFEQVLTKDSTEELKIDSANSDMPSCKSTIPTMSSLQIIRQTSIIYEAIKDFDVNTAIQNCHCPCKITGDSGPYMKCTKCSKYRHAACFGYLENDTSVLTSYCHECCPEKLNVMLFVDPMLVDVPEFHNHQMICLWRRTLLMLVMRPEVTVQMFYEFLQNSALAPQIFNTCRKLNLMDINSDDPTICTANKQETAKALRRCLVSFGDESSYHDNVHSEQTCSQETKTTTANSGGGMWNNNHGDQHVVVSRKRIFSPIHTMISN